MPLSSELLPCPFCGCADIRTSHIRDGRCCGCMSCGASVRAYNGPTSAEDRVRAAWNTRALDQAARQDERAKLAAPLPEGEMRERIARLIDPSAWRVMDGYLADMQRKYRRQDYGYDPEAFKHQGSLAKADAILALFAEERAKAQEVSSSVERLPAGLRPTEDPHSAGGGEP